MTTLSYISPYLTFPFPTFLKKKSPFPLSFRKYIVTLPDTDMQNEEQAILMRTILLTNKDAEERTKDRKGNSKKNCN